MPSERVAAAGLGDRITCCCKDYRDLAGRYDKLVSIEMIEAIGAQYLETYFGTARPLLKPDGLALLQAITIEDHRYAQALQVGGLHQAPRVSRQLHSFDQAMLAAKTRASDLALVASRGLRRLLRAHPRGLARSASWRSCPQVRALGFDERFIRMWEFYLAYCEGGFRERSIGVAHMVLAKPGRRRAGTLADAEIGG